MFAVTIINGLGGRGLLPVAPKPVIIPLNPAKSISSTSRREAFGVTTLDDIFSDIGD